MKKLILILLCFVSVPLLGTDYYVKTAGSDSNTGLSDAQAWKTITKVNAEWSSGKFIPGDRIFFNRGDTFRGTLTVASSGSPLANITIGAYEYVGSSTIPIVSTSPVLNITETTAVSGGYISSDGGHAVTARGVCWSTSTGPTTADDKTEDGTGTGSFTSNVTGLTNGETYYLRAYATNSIGTAYGLERVFTTPIPTSSGVRFIMHDGVFVIHNGKFIKSE